MDFKVTIDQFDGPLDLMLHLIKEQQLDLFSLTEDPKQKEEKLKDDKTERARQEAVLKIRGRFGKNAIVRGMDLQEAATAMERNAQVGGHKA